MTAHESRPPFPPAPSFPPAPARGVIRLRRPLPGRLILLAFPSVLLFSACRGNERTSSSNLDLEVGISPTPPVVGPARLIITLTDSLGNPVDGAVVRVEGNMSHAGMVPVQDTAAARGEGTYVVPDFRFTMGGDWILTVTATLSDGRTASLRKSTGVGGGGDGGGT